MATSDVIDVAIIGAGVSGAYCAHRLSADTTLSVGIFERENRVGGRLWSYRWPEADALVELGGEAFAPFHANVAGLVRTLGLTAVPHKEFSTLNRLHLRDRLLGPGDLVRKSAFAPIAGAAAVLRYFVPDDYLAPAGGGGGPDAIDDPFTFLGNHILAQLPPDVGQAFGTLCAGYAARVAAVAAQNPVGGPLTAAQALTLMTPEIYDALGALIDALEHARVTVSPASARILGEATVPLHDFDFWSVVVGAYGQEVYELYRNAGYDNTAALYYNMSELVQSLLIGALFGMATPGFWSLEGGFDTLPKAMVQAAEARGAELSTGMTLQAIARDPATGLLRLQFVDAAGTPITRQARRVVMTAPLTALDSGIVLEGFDADLTARFARNRASLFQVAAGKLFLVYPEAWWAAMSDLPPGSDPLFGYASTDMPSRSIYYKGLTGDGQRALITGALTDGINADFWASFERPGNALFPGTGAGTPDDLAAPRQMVDACHRILTRVHAEGLSKDFDIPDLALWHGWTRSGAGWAAWQSGVAIHKVAAELRQPFLRDGIDQGLVCCGDSTAERHGWVENVLESAETLLRDAFGLSPAAWLPSRVTF